jgi:hypothetical protein
MPNVRVEPGWWYLIPDLGPVRVVSPLFSSRTGWWIVRDRDGCEWWEPWDGFERELTPDEVEVLHPMNENERKRV